MRHFLILMHRYVGLMLVPFLLIVGLTGSVLAFYDGLDRWLNPSLLTVPVPENDPGTPFDPFALRGKAEALQPRGRVDWFDLRYKPGRTVRYFLLPRINPETGEPFKLPYNEMYFNPYTGELVGTRTFAKTLFSKESVMSFLYRLHYALAMPDQLFRFGSLVLGVAALLWFFDNFVGLYLTFPARQKQNGKPREKSNPPGKSLRRFLKRWKPAWKVKFSRFTYDLHRASGLWVWGLLLVMAWSGMAFNLKEVYEPVMSGMLNMRAGAPPAVKPPVNTPLMDWGAAREHGRRHVQAASARYGFSIAQEISIAVDRERGVYDYRVKTDQDMGKGGATVTVLNAYTGELIRLTLPATDSVGDAVHRWITWLHTARVFGRPMQIIVCTTGIIVVSLSVTGVMIWWRKRTPNKNSGLAGDA